MDSKNNIGTQIKSRLEHLSASPDASVWENIEKELKKKRRKRVIFFWWLSSGSVLTVALVTALFYGYSTSKNIHQEKTQDVKKTILQKNNTEDNTDLNEELITSSKSEEQQKSSAPIKVNLLGPSKNKTSSKAINESRNTENTSTIAKETNNTSSPTKESVTQQNNKTELEEELSIEVSDVTSNEETKKLKEIDEKQKDSTENKDKSRWSVTPQGLLSYYGTLKESSSNNTSYNYGFLASYKMNSQFYARTGIRLLNLNQDINGISREVTYYQFPIEIKYVPFQHKINPYAVGGFSYYSLRDSKTNVSNQDFQATVGLNAGLGAEVKLWKKTFVNFESIFNYQLMPFSQKSDIKPYILNLSLGIEYRF
ncbi:MAG: porin family protein [Winogradskyella sp.]|nr:MAG: porin family protein [Winogradskyella sp.]